MLAFYDYPAEHWVHLRTTNPIESTFATVRHHTKITRGPVHTDHVFGVASRRPQFERLTDRLETGDTFVVWRLDRLGRSLKHLIEVITKLGERGIA